jgi:hypothetical protein
MLRIKIQWVNLNLHQQATPRKQIHLYLFEKDGDIKYIGYSNELSLVKEVSEYLRLFDINMNEIKIWGGTIQIPNGEELISRDLIESAICLMVNQIKPQFNVVCKSAYYGYGNLSVVNDKCPFLQRHFSIYNTLGYLPTAGIHG